MIRNKQLKNLRHIKKSLHINDMCEDTDSYGFSFTNEGFANSILTQNTL